MNQEEKNTLSEALEKILFNKSQLNTLKLAIKKVDTGQITSQEVWDLTIKTRASCIEEIVKLVMFQKSQSSDRVSLNSTLSVDVKNQLYEKDTLLQEVGTRINRIYTKLREKMHS